jgi:hypothetical protein
MITVGRGSVVSVADGVVGALARAVVLVGMVMVVPGAMTVIEGAGMVVPPAVSVPLAPPVVVVVLVGASGEITGEDVLLLVTVTRATVNRSRLSNKTAAMSGVIHAPLCSA